MKRLALAVCLLLPWHVTHAAQRVVSLNLCTDQMLVLLAPEKAVGLTPLARDPSLSAVATAASAMPSVRASAEAVLRLRPDLVLAARFGAQTTLSVLEQHGLTVLRADLPADFAGIRQWTRDLGRLLDAPTRAEALIEHMDRVLAGRAADGPVITALALEPRGYVAGADTILAAAMRAAGLTPRASSSRISLERLLRNPPDLLVLSAPPDAPSLATDMLLHPALRGLPTRFVPPSLVLCPTPLSAQAVPLLRP